MAIALAETEAGHRLGLREVKGRVLWESKGEREIGGLRFQRRSQGKCGV